jgi:hypothetical protein
MSNLSELLPTGGGQNAVNFVASGTLSSGQTVALKADGSVEAITPDANPPSADAPVVYSGTSSVFLIKAAYDSGNDKIVLAYNDGGNSNYGTAIVGTVSGTSISFGSPVVYGSAYAPYGAPVYDSANGKVVIPYRDDGNSGYYTAKVGTVSGTSISFGTAVVFSSTVASTTIGAVYDSANSKVVIAFQDFYTFQRGRAVVGTVSGTSISFGTAPNFTTSSTDAISAAYDSSNGKVVIFWGTTSGGAFGKAIVATVSGTSISFGALGQFENGLVDWTSATYDSSNNKVVVAYRDSEVAGTAAVGTVSGTSISFGTPVVFDSSVSTYISATYDSTNAKICIAYRDNGNSNYGTAVVGTVSGTSISFGTPVVYETATTRDQATTYDPDSQKVVIAYRDDGNSSYGTALLFSTGSSNSADFIGITAGAISDTATGAVNVYGGINEAQTGLTIGADYYVQDDGSISTTSSSVKVGQAISATTINMMDLT